MKNVARKSQVSEVAFDGLAWVGVDIHKKSYAVAVTDKQGVSRVFSMPADENGLAASLQQMSNAAACVAYEAGPCGYSLYRTMREAGFPAQAAAPSRISRPVTRSTL